MHGAPLPDGSRLEVVFKIIDERDALVIMEYHNKIQSAPPPLERTTVILGPIPEGCCFHEHNLDSKPKTVIIGGWYRLNAVCDC